MKDLYYPAKCFHNGIVLVWFANRISNDRQAIAYLHPTIKSKYLWAHSFRFMFQFRCIDTCLFTRYLPLIHSPLRNHPLLSSTRHSLLPFPTSTSTQYSLILIRVHSPILTYNFSHETKEVFLPEVFLLKVYYENNLQMLWTLTLSRMYY